MKILIAEDDLASRKFLFNVLTDYGKCDLVVDGLEAIDAVMIALKEKEPYDLICLDIMMPKVDGLKTLKAIRDLEKHSKMINAKIIMTTALGESEIVQNTFEEGSDAYAAKPINIEKFLNVLSKLELITR
ncbi:two-component system chemotaxis response regulator CheY [Natranaerovirga pectinivora]|uniref:Stage 0 sporulation protein A homolog n=1 Tax=Natranaerovirga pectinivora TaxID=682400 RepID=A0A4R3MF58_9FIRM|nr:response regulator [Natranaerovirga pectinivora]TCT12131.1 two-component system chemotaxis response regulator CheY [Natranaerovirga pectinivora]